MGDYRSNKTCEEIDALLDKAGTSVQRIVVNGETLTPSKEGSVELSSSDGKSYYVFEYTYTELKEATNPITVSQDCIDAIKSNTPIVIKDKDIVMTPLTVSLNMGTDGKLTLMFNISLGVEAIELFTLRSVTFADLLLMRVVVKEQKLSTINGTSLKDSANLSLVSRMRINGEDKIPDGSGVVDLGEVKGGSDVYIAEFTISEIDNAIANDGSIVISKALVEAVKSGHQLVIREKAGSVGSVITSAWFTDDPDGGVVIIECISTRLLVVDYQIRFTAFPDMEEYAIKGYSIAKTIIQPRLVSGETLKTLNGESLLGRGDIEIKENVTGDWMENDEGSDAYIKNRTHCIEKTINIYFGMTIGIPRRDIQNYRIIWDGMLLSFNPDGNTTVYDSQGIYVCTLVLTVVNENSFIFNYNTYNTDKYGDTPPILRMASKFEGGVKFLDDFYLPGNVVYNDKLKTINGESIVGDGDIKTQPYRAPFDIGDLQGAVEKGSYTRFPKDVFVTALRNGRPLEVPITRGVFTGIPASYYRETTADGSQIIVDVIHGTKVYHLVLDDIEGESSFTISPDNTTCKDTSEVYITPYTLDEFEAANGRVLRVSKEFAEAAFNKKMILIPTGKTVSNGYYVVATSVGASDPTLGTYIRLQVYIDSSYKTIVLNSKVIAPTSVSCTVGTTELITEKRLKGLMNADTVTITGPKAEVSVNSIDGASFTRNGVQTAMTPNTVYNFTDNGVKRTIAVYDDHRLVLTSEGEVEFEYPITYTSSERVLPSALPSSLVTQPELRTAIEEATPDWYSDGGAGFIKNRTHYFKSINSFAPGQGFTVFAGQNGPVSAIDDAKFYFRGELYDLPKIIGEEFSYHSETNKVISVVLQNISEISQLVSYHYTTGSHGGLTQEELPLKVVGPLKRLSKIYLPEDVVYEDELPQSDWNESDDTKPTYVNNRTHFAGLKGVFNIGDRFSLSANTGTHSPESYRLRYKGELYKLPNVGEKAYYPNESNADFFIFLSEGTSGSYTTYTISSTVINEAVAGTGVEVFADYISKKLDDFYIPDTIARTKDFYTKSEIDNAISSAITTTLNTPV